MRAEILTLFLFFFLFYIFYIHLGYSLSDVFFTSLTLSLLPYLFYQFLISKIEEEKENNFFRFSIDLVDLLKSGLSLPYALEQLEKSDYGRLSPLIKNLSSRVNWGLGIIESFNLFTEECNNKTISTIMKNVISIYKSGGELDKGLEASVKSIKEARNLKKQRESLLFENVVHSYIVFIFFLVTVLILIIFLLPFLDITISEKRIVKSEDIINILYLISVIQSFFSGIIIGKMYKGSIRAGIKHSIFFLLLTLIFFKFVISVFPKSLDISKIFVFG